jgi:hypothetical protein
VDIPLSKVRADGIQTPPVAVSRHTAKLAQGDKIEMSAQVKSMVAAAVMAAAGLFASSASAAVFLGFQHNGGAIVTMDTDASLVQFVGAFGAFEVNVYSGTDGVYPQLLGTSGHTRNRVGGNAGTLDVYVTVTDLTTAPGHFQSSFATNVLPAGWTLTTTTYANDDNALWGIGGTLLSSKTFNSIGVFEHLGAASVENPYSVTARYTITAPSHGEALANISVAGVPEPGAWALMIMGFGAAGALLRRRRTTAAA